MDAGLRKIYLACLDRDLRFADVGALDEVVPPIDWRVIKRRWNMSRAGGVRVVITNHDLPPITSGYRVPRPGGGGSAAALAVAYGHVPGGPFDG